METYDIVFSEGAVKDLKVIPQKEQLKILDKIELLAANPFPKGCIKSKLLMMHYGDFAKKTTGFYIV